MSWHHDALCAGHPLTDFVLDSGPGKVRADLRQQEAARICAGCPVKTDCLNDAKRYGDSGVVRGGRWLTQPTHIRPLSLSA